MPSKIQIEAVADVRDAARNLNSLESNVGTLTDSFTTLKGRATLAMKDMAIDAGVQLATKFGGDVLGAIQSVDRMEFAVTEAFGPSGALRRDIEEWADSVNEDFGVAQARVEELTADIALQMQQSGFAADEAANLAKQIAEAGLAMSLFRPEVDNAREGTDLITAALRGEKDALFNLIGELEFTGDASTDLGLILNALSEDFAFVSSGAADNQLAINELKAKYDELVLAVAGDALPILEGLAGVLGTIAQLFGGATKAVEQFNSAIERIPSVPIPNIPQPGDGGILDFLVPDSPADLLPLPNFDVPFVDIPDPTDLGRKLFGGATGAIVTQPTLSIIGEAGPEALVPLNSAPGASPLPAGFGGGSGVIEIHVHVEPQKIARAAAEGSISLGGLPFKVRGAR